MATPPLKRSRKTPKRKDTSVDADSIKVDLADGKRKSLSQLTNDELKAQLIKHGEKPGPITDSTRKPYEKLLVRKWQNNAMDCSSPVTIVTTPSPAATSAEKRNTNQNLSSTYTPLTSKRLTNKVFRPVTQDELNGNLTLSNVKPSKQFFVEGLVADVLTPFHRNGELNLSVIPQYINFLVKDGITLCHVCGDAGEYKSLTIDDRKAVMQEWVKVSKGKLQGVICNVSCDSLVAAIELARYAYDASVSAISCTCPNYGSKIRIGTLTSYLSNISRAAPNIPLIYNHSERIIITSSAEPFTPLNLEEILNCIAFDVSTFCGLQYNGYNLCDYGLCKTSSVHSKTYHMILGRDEQFLGGLAVGCTVFQSCMYSYLGKLYNGIIDCFKLGNIHEARRLQNIAYTVNRKLNSYGQDVTIHKAMMTLRGLDIGVPRAPLKELSGDMITKLKNEMTQLGIFICDTAIQSTNNIY